MIQRTLATLTTVQIQTFTVPINMREQGARITVTTTDKDILAL